VCCYFTFLVLKKKIYINAYFYDKKKARFFKILFVSFLFQIIDIYITKIMQKSHSKNDGDIPGVWLEFVTRSVYKQNKKVEQSPKKGGDRHTHTNFKF